VLALAKKLNLAYFDCFAIGVIWCLDKLAALLFSGNLSLIKVIASTSEDKEMAAHTVA
jgi:hypothetical protein